MGYPSLYLLHAALGKTSADSRLHVCVPGCFLIYRYQSTHEAVLRVEKWGAKQMTGPGLHGWAVRGNS